MGERQGEEVEREEESRHEGGTVGDRVWDEQKTADSHLPTGVALCS